MGHFNQRTTQRKEKFDRHIHGLMAVRGTSINWSNSFCSDSFNPLLSLFFHNSASNLSCALTEVRNASTFSGFIAARSSASSSKIKCVEVIMIELNAKIGFLMAFT